MKSRFFATLTLLAVFLAACAPAATETPSSEPASARPIIESTVTPPVDLTATHIYTAASPNSSTPAPTVQAVATSRGPKLEATDPKTVSISSGGLQFVEFFEFW